MELLFNIITVIIIIYLTIGFVYGSVMTYLFWAKGGLEEDNGASFFDLIWILARCMFGWGEIIIRRICHKEN